MKTIKVIITTIIITVFVAPFCQSQSKSVKYSTIMAPKIKPKLYSLYPHATSVVKTFERTYPSDSTQEIQINCHCDETTGMIILLFDTNGNLLNKEVHYHSLKDLPDTIVNYMKKKRSDTVKFITNYVIKSINNKGEVSYGIIMNYSPNSWSLQQYILKFKSTGELISKEKMPEGRL